MDVMIGPDRIKGIRYIRDMAAKNRITSLISW